MAVAAAQEHQRPERAGVDQCAGLLQRRMIAMVEADADEPAAPRAPRRSAGRSRRPTAPPASRAGRACPPRALRAPATSTPRWWWRQSTTLDVGPREGAPSTVSAVAPGYCVRVRPRARDRGRRRRRAGPARAPRRACRRSARNRGSRRRRLCGSRARLEQLRASPAGRSACAGRRR